MEVVNKKVRGGGPPYLRRDQQPLRLAYQFHLATIDCNYTDKDPGRFQLARTLYWLGKARLILQDMSEHQVSSRQATTVAIRNIQTHSMR